MTASGSDAALTSAESPDAGSAPGVVAPGFGDASEAAPGLPPGSRTSRVLGAVKIGYVYQAAVLVTGLWLTPFLIEHLGQYDYGLWLTGSAVVGWLALMDLGIVALLPRDTAVAIGRIARGADPAILPRLIDRTVMLVMWQVPLVALVSAVVWMVFARQWGPLAGPLMIVFATFVIGFPLRVLQAMLQGLQDLAFVGAATLGAWAAGFFVTVALVAGGMGLYSLAAGWVVVQVVQHAASWRRLHARHEHALPRRLTRLAWTDARALLGSGVWISVAQVAQVLLAGTDIVIIARILGPEAVTVYGVTAKLVLVLANQPQAIMTAALPGIAEIRGTADMDRLRRVSSALSQVLLIASSLVFCVVLAVNEAFVTWWIRGEVAYAGDTLTALFLLSMLLRHWNFSAVYTLFSLGGERRVSITTLIDGTVTVVLSIILVRRFGIIGAPVGSLIGVAAVSLPANLRGLSAAAGIPIVEWLRPLWGWAWRFLLVASAALALSRVAIPATFVWLAVASCATAAVVLLVMLPVALRPPLGTYLSPRLAKLGIRARTN